MVKGLYGFNVAVKKESHKEVVERWAAIFGVQPVYLKPSDFAVPGIIGAKLKVGEANIFILAGDNEKVALAQFVAKNGEGVFLVSFEVDDLEKAMKEVVDQGVKFVSDKPLSFPGGRVNFIHPKSMNGVQTEFIQIEK
ncbi:VOC family protein [Desulfosarcina ovata]|uniref:Methylmalonyl-CoA epimerase n=1 Tax=Desulfosarcina ovata subsp. ovata TaxID=2752305 RepID=A0A5K8A6K5_9BACT|nr:VOC family protein [Desulfosarcina ovata]BBO88101.1 methylmalonyl-CoA epimerase [Desulfosarcina ovata subsp. ovata]